MFLFHSTHSKPFVEFVGVHLWAKYLLIFKRRRIFLLGLFTVKKICRYHTHSFVSVPRANKHIYLFKLLIEILVNKMKTESPLRKRFSGLPRREVEKYDLIWGFRSRNKILEHLSLTLSPSNMRAAWMRTRNFFSAAARSWKSWGHPSIYLKSPHTHPGAWCTARRTRILFSHTPSKWRRRERNRGSWARRAIKVQNFGNAAAALRS